MIHCGLQLHTPFLIFLPTLQPINVAAACSQTTLLKLPYINNRFALKSECNINGGGESIEWERGEQWVASGAFTVPRLTLVLRNSM